MSNIVPYEVILQNNEAMHSTYSIVTRSRASIVKPNSNYAMMVTTFAIPKEPHNVRSALADPSRKATMEEELASLHKNKTWKLVPHVEFMHFIVSH